MLSDISHETDQILELLGRINQSASTVLMEVDFLGHDLTDVPATLLATAVNRLERVVLWRADLTEQQKVSIFTAAAAGSCCRYLDLSEVSLVSECIAAVTHLKPDFS